ncbi:uncharacterized protein LOC130691648 isoform X2 [Daphnia carinata]|uniref:uncharacterized protein LOC130691648 isoform X2 n=1 Tax=Daphnia carinata TaxID=120202 RepID=UPI00257C693C|nr:uncharacterized protein LOC130691648 isoform X2 [Daphnia carinata]
MKTSHFIGFFFVLLHAHRTSALSCGWPGKPVGGILVSASLPTPLQDDIPSFGRAYVPTNRVLSYEYQFQEGQVVAYQCHTSRLDVLTGTYSNRTCQSDGRWSGTRPWCDLNVAYGKTVNYAGLETSRVVTLSDTLMTDGLIDSEDPLNTAECPSLARGGGAYFTVNLGEEMPVRVVGIFGKKGEGMNNLENKKVTLGSANCPQRTGNASAFGYQCNQAMSQATTSNLVGSTVRFEHSSTFVVDICEVVIYANPTLADCGEPEIPAFGEVTITTASLYQEARYNCRVGYELQGTNLRTCYGRDWAGEQPICVEIYVPPSTEVNYNSTTTFPGGDGSSNGGGLDPFQIVLIVVCVALAIGLIVALIVLLYYGRISCCGTAGNKFAKKLSKKKKPSSNDQRDYQKVATPQTKPATSATAAASKAMQDASKREAALAAAEQERRAEEEDFINTRLAYQNERAVAPQQMQRKAAPTPDSSANPTPLTTPQIPKNPPITYAELSHEPTRRLPESPATLHSLSNPSNPVAEPEYAQVKMRPGSRNSKNNAQVNNDGAASDTTDVSTTSPPARKSYIPSIYLKESPDVQMKQQALNNQLKEAVRISRNTDF